MIIKINDNKTVFSSIVSKVKRTVFFLYKYYKRLKRKIKTPKSIKTSFIHIMIHLKKDV